MKALRPDELSIRFALEAHELATDITSGRGDTDAYRSGVDRGDTYPRRGDMPATFLKRQFAFEAIPCDRRHIGVGVVHAEEIEEGERSDEREGHPPHFSASAVFFSIVRKG